MKKRIGFVSVLAIGLLATFVGCSQSSVPEAEPDTPEATATSGGADVQRPPVIIVDPTGMTTGQGIQWEKDNKPVGRHTGMTIHPDWENFPGLYGKPAGSPRESAKRIVIEYSSGKALEIKIKNQKLEWSWEGKKLDVDNSLESDTLPEEFFAPGTIRFEPKGGGSLQAVPEGQFDK